MERAQRHFATKLFSRHSLWRARCGWLSLVLALSSSLAPCSAADDVSARAKEIATAGLKGEMHALFKHVEDEIEYVVQPLANDKAIVVVWCSLASDQFLMAFVDLKNERVEHKQHLGGKKNSQVERMVVAASNHGGGYVAWHQNRQVHVCRIDGEGKTRAHVIYPFYSMRFAIAELSKTEIVLVNNNSDSKIHAARIRYAALPDDKAAAEPGVLLTSDALLHTHVAISIENGVGVCTWQNWHRNEDNSLNFSATELMVARLRFPADKIEFDKPRFVEKLVPLPRLQVGSPPLEGKLQVDLASSDKTLQAKILWTPTYARAAPQTFETEFPLE